MISSIISLIYFPLASHPFVDWFSIVTCGNFFDLQVFEDAIPMFPVFFGFVFFWFGCNIGSFLNVCVYRIPLGISLISPPSHCPNCNHKITALENIPVFSYLFLGRKCRQCHLPISPRYFIGEVTIGLLYAASFIYVLKMRLPLRSLFLYFLLISVALPSAIIDMRTRLLPNQLTYTLLLLGPLYHLLHSVFFPPHFLDFTAFFASLLTMILFGGFLTFFALIGESFFHREALGLGDVKLIAGFASCLGALPTLWILLTGSVIALGVIPFYSMRHPKIRKRGFPFGPFLCIALLIWLFFGISLTDHVLYPDREIDLSLIEFIHSR